MDAAKKRFDAAKKAIREEIAHSKAEDKRNKSAVRKAKALAKSA